MRFAGDALYGGWEGEHHISPQGRTVCVEGTMMSLVGDGGGDSR